MTAQVRLRYELEDYDAWRAIFDRDPLDRKGSGVRRYRIARDTADPRAVLVDLDFDSLERAEDFHARLRQLLASPDLPPLARADTLVTEVTEAVDL